MAEVSSLFSGVQIGAETTPGTGVAASRLLNYLNFQPTFWPGNFNTMRPMGQKVSSAVAPGYDYTTWALSSDIGSYSEFIYPYCSLLGNVTPTTVDTSAKLWTFTPNPRSEDTAKTYTVETGSASTGSSTRSTAAPASRLQVRRRDSRSRTTSRSRAPRRRSRTSRSWRRTWTSSWTRPRAHSDRPS
jgi:hypothetical protein